MRGILNSENARKKLEDIYICYRRDLYITAYSILRNPQEAEDVVQNAILRVSENLEKIFEVKCKKTRSYLVIIVRNLCYSLYNEKKEMECLPFDEIQTFEQKEEVPIEEFILKIEESDEIARLMGELHPSYADILTLRYYHELEIGEIAKILGISENNAGVRLHRASKALKKILEERGEKLDGAVI